MQGNTLNGLMPSRVDELALRIAFLTAGFLQQTLSTAEHDELTEWITAGKGNRLLFEELINPNTIAKALHEYKNIDSKAALERIKKKISFTERKQPFIPLTSKRISILMRSFLPSSITIGK